MLACSTSLQFVHFLSSSLLIETQETSPNTKTKSLSSGEILDTVVSLGSRLDTDRSACTPQKEEHFSSFSSAGSTLCSNLYRPHANVGVNKAGGKACHE